MKLRTELQANKSAFQISYEDNLLLLGSCFSENIGHFLKKNKFKAQVNPLGISYNPASILKNITRAIDLNHLVKEELQFAQDRFFHFDFHGNNNHTSNEYYLTNINDQISNFHQYLKSADVIFISLGTANVFEHIEKGIVNNCHKEPNSSFNRKTLSFEEVKLNANKIINQITTFNANAKIVFTVSPIRHIRDGLINDRLSKSILIASISEVVNNYPQICSYFPSYELLVDDLRDYRFYKQDLIHPNEMALTYIWETFTKCYFSDKTSDKLTSIKKIINGFNHKPISPHSTKHLDFLSNLKNQMLALDDIDFSDELNKLESK